MSSDVYSYCKLCKKNHTLQQKHIYTKKHKLKLKTVLQKYGQKIKDCRPYLNNPVIQEGEFEPDAKFWCHCCNDSFKKHVTDGFKSILYGGVIEHLASEDHWENTENFFRENGADEKFKISFIISQTDIALFKSKLEPLVDIYNHKATARTNALAKKLESQELDRRHLVRSQLQSASCSKQEPKYKTVKNNHGILQNPTGYHDGIRVWKGGIVKYKKESDQIQQHQYPYGKQTQFKPHYVANSFKGVYTVSADGGGLTSVGIKYDSRKGNIYSGATPPWLRAEEKDSSGCSSKEYGPSIKDLQNHLNANKKRKLNPNRVGANFDHTVSQNDKETEWLPSFGRVWNNGARWKSRREYHNETKNESAEYKKPRK